MANLSAPHASTDGDGDGQASALGRTVGRHRLNVSATGPYGAAAGRWAPIGVLPGVEKKTRVS
jgi:hypothetical protein